ncbi:MAG TPA: AMP-binding protein, partial [Acidimicrobiales bacterium]|nr:AMP-binding protein [Acidimicrobiales bacterium]
VTTYGDLRRQVAAARARLGGTGVGPDDRVAIVLGNEPAFVVAYLAVVGLGAVAVPLNPASPPPELDRQRTAADVSAMLDGADDLGLADDAAKTPPIVERQPDDLAALMFTAGTAGAPRAAMLTHGNLLANIDQVQRQQPIDAKDVVLGVLPLFHIFGLNVVLGGALAVGAQVLLIDHFEPRSALDLIRRHQVSVLIGAPTMYAALAGVPPENPRQHLPRVRLAVTGAAPLSYEVADLWQRRYGLPLRQGYGLTEASPVVTSATLDGPVITQSIGIPLPGVEVRLVDDEGEDALAGDAGQIWVRGPNVFPGYWRDDRATEAALTEDGWLRTGDVAVAGDDGQLYIVDRVKDLIIVSGFNVFPAEVEAVLAEHPAVAEVAVVGADDAYQGETVHAFVVLEPGQQVTADQLSAWARDRLARYKCPSEISFVPSLPHGLGGKLLRRSLRSKQSAEG